MSCPGFAFLLAAVIACFAVFLEHVISQDQQFSPWIDPGREYDE